MELFILKCENCGADMNLTEDKTKAVCPYCDHKYYVKQDERSNNYVIEKEIQKNIKFVRGSMLGCFFAICIPIVIFIFFPLICFVLVSIFKISVDPFNCINLNYSGISGHGRVEIEDNNKCDYFSDIEYSVSQKESLKENQIITITADSKSILYKLKKNKKNYKVKGLSVMLNNLSDISDNIKQEIHNYSSEYIKNNCLSGIYKGEIVKIEPHKLYLMSNNNDSDYLFDLYKIIIKDKDSVQYEKYIVIEYENFIITNDDQYSYDNVKYYGNTIRACDPNQMSSLYNNYCGVLTGFNTINEFEMSLKSLNKGSYTITNE